jgi:hypothetical protein
VVRKSIIAVLALALAACNRSAAPDDAGVCWRVSPGSAGGFVSLARNIDSLENCAVLLEGARLQGQTPTDGAYQGYFIFDNATEISSASHRGGFHYPIFQPPQRAAVDRDLRRLIRERGGRLPNAGDITLERQ